MRRLLLIACLLIFAIGTNGWAYTFEDSGLYHSYTELASWAANLQAQNPNLVNVVQYGTSAEGRPLLALDITVNPLVNDPAKPEFLFTAGIHAREVITSESARSLAETLVNGYRNGDSQFISMLSTRDVWIVPDQNPDGRMVVEGGHSEQRKNWHWYAGQNTNDYTRGVDLNRNYPHQWTWGSANVLDDTYHGPSPLSEPEASSLWTLLHDQNRFSHLLGAIDFHSGVAAILTPWTSPSDYYLYPPPLADRQKFDFLAAGMQQLTGYSTDRLGYDSWGTLTDSLYEEFGTYAVTEELFGGSFFDYFEYFNPIDQATRDATLNKAVSSAMFLLSDEAFAVPEPATLVLLAAAGCVALIWRATQRRGRRRLGAAGHLSRV